MTIAVGQRSAIASAVSIAFGSVLVTSAPIRSPTSSRSAHSRGGPGGLVEVPFGRGGHLVDHRHGVTHIGDGRAPSADRSVGGLVRVAVMAAAALFTGVGVALVTLFDDEGEIDAPATADHAARLVEAGVDAVVVAGTTGEAAALDADERSDLLVAVRSRSTAGCR